MPPADPFRVFNGETPRISRRQLARNFLAAAAAGWVSPSVIHPIHRHLLNAALLDSADALLSSAAGRALFFTPGQLAALKALAEAIVPGSGRAQSAEFIGLLLSVDTRQAQSQFLADLAAFEAHSETSYQRKITALSPSRLHDLLLDISRNGSVEQNSFERLKDWVVPAYYSSEVGMRELGWTPDRVFPAYPGCSHQDGHA